MYEQFGYPGLFAAYNAGPGRYAQHLAGRRALPDETVRYLASVAPPTRVPAAAVAVAPPPMSLFAVRRDAAPRSEKHTSELQSLMRISYAVFCLKKTKVHTTKHIRHTRNSQ